MKTLRTVSWPAFLVFLSCQHAFAQPMFFEIRNWTFDTRIGRIGYREVRQEPGGLEPSLPFTRLAGSGSN